MKAHCCPQCHSTDLGYRAWKAGDTQQWIHKCRQCGYETPVARSYEESLKDLSETDMAVQADLYEVSR